MPQLIVLYDVVV